MLSGKFKPVQNTVATISAVELLLFSIPAQLVNLFVGISLNW